MSTERPLVALISATPAAIPPIELAFATRAPWVRVWNLLDDRLLVDAGEQGGVTERLQSRMRRLIEHAIMEGADGVLLTCSLYGFVARAMAPQSPVPVFGPDDAAFDDAVASGARRVAMVGSIELSVQDSVERLRAHASALEVQLDVAPKFVAGALAAGKAGDVDGVAQLVVTAIDTIDPPVDAVLFAQYSLAPATEGIERTLGVPVFSGPDRAVLAMLTALEGPKS